jgi:DNA-directed RNA polymerase specialized sigma24 family protein
LAIPLRKRKLDGSPYFRPEAIEKKLQELELLPRDNLMERCRIRDRADPGYVPTECVMHFIRASHRDNSETRFASLYRVLLERAAHCLPRSRNTAHISSSHAEINDLVMDTFNVLLSSDRNEYSEKLDYFEIRFDGAMARLRIHAQRKIWPRQNRNTQIENVETGELRPEVEQAIENYNPFEDAKIEDRDYRSRLDGAIDTLPPLQQRIVHMLRKGIPIDSQDTYAVTISKTLGKVEKTIRSNRDKAYAALKRILEGDPS